MGVSKCFSKYPPKYVSGTRHFRSCVLLIWRGNMDIMHPITYTYPHAVCTWFCCDYIIGFYKIRVIYICMYVYVYIYMYMYIYINIVYMWQMSSVFSHESAQRNDAGHLIDKNVFKTTRKSGNTKPLVAKWPCCFKDIFIYLYIYIYPSDCFTDTGAIVLLQHMWSTPEAYR